MQFFCHSRRTESLLERSSAIAMGVLKLGLEIECEVKLVDHEEMSEFPSVPKRAGSFRRESVGGSDEERLLYIQRHSNRSTGIHRESNSSVSMDFCYVSSCQRKE